MELLTLVGCFIALGGSGSSGLSVKVMAFCSDHPMLRTSKVSGNSESMGFGI